MPVAPRVRLIYHAPHGRSVDGGVGSLTTPSEVMRDITLHRIPMLVRTAAVVAAVALLPVTSPAAAEPVQDDLQLHTTVLPVGARIPTLSELQRSADALRKALGGESSAFSAPHGAPEIVGPAAAHGRIDRQASAVASQPAPRFTAAAVTYPAPARTLTPQECIKGLGTDKKFFIKSRYAACSGAVFYSVWTRNNQPVGETQFVYLSIGTIAKDSRAVRMTQYFTQMKKTGTVSTSAMMITPKVKVPKVWPSAARVAQTGAVPGARSFDTLAAQQSTGFTRTLNAAPGQGTGRDDAIASVFEASATITPPPGHRPTGELSGTLFFLPPRWDKASYLKVPQGAAVFTYLVPLHYSTKAGAPERAVAEHIKTAFTKPASTKPSNARKKVPGQSVQAPLHRLYYDSARRKKNRSTAVSTCRREFGPNYAAGGKECDEYPFATTYEGCAQPTYETSAPKNNYSVRALPGADNGNAGNLLGQFMTLNRIVDGKDDGFFMSLS